MKHFSVSPFSNFLIRFSTSSTIFSNLVSRNFLISFSNSCSSFGVVEIFGKCCFKVSLYPVSRYDVSCLSFLATSVWSIAQSIELPPVVRGLILVWMSFAMWPMKSPKVWSFIISILAKAGNSTIRRSRWQSPEEKIKMLGQAAFHLQPTLTSFCNIPEE